MATITNCFQDPGMISYANDLHTGREVVIDHMWLRLIQIIFPWHEDFLHQREDYPSPESQSRVDVSLSILNGNSRKKAIVIECKRGATSHREPTPRAWTKAQNQLIGFCEKKWRAQGPLPCRFSLPAVTVIGKYAMFYEFRPILRQGRAMSRVEKAKQLKEKTPKRALNMMEPQDQIMIQKKLRAIKARIDSWKDGLTRVTRSERH